MEEQALQLGDAELTEFLSEPVEVGTEQREHLDSLILMLLRRESHRELFSVEKATLRRLYAQKAQHTYPELDLSFLNMSNAVEYEGEEILLPRFSVYRLSDKKGSNEFSVSFRFDKSTDGGNSGWAVYLPDLPRIFLTQILKSTDFYQNCEEHTRINHPHKGNLLYHKFFKVTKEIGKKYKSIIAAGRERGITCTSTFQGIIPDETLVEVEEAEKIFGENGLFVITETKPKEWNIVDFSKDPLFVGLMDNKCFLVNSSYTTPMEKVIGREYRR